jgi:hypothetical protein
MIARLGAIGQAFLVFLLLKAGDVRLAGGSCSSLTEK